MPPMINDLIKEKAPDVNELTRQAIERGDIATLLSVWRGLNNRRSGYDTALNEVTVSEPMVPQVAKIQ